jgi:ribosome biogenesis GTPase A
MGDYWRVIDTVVRKADIILLVIDARMPEMTRNTKLEEIITSRGRKLIYVFNKIDLVKPSDLKKIRENHPEAFFVSGVNNIGLSKLKEGLFIAAKKIGIQLPHIGVVGYPNVGKSAIINALAHRAKTQVSSIAGTTKGVQWVKVGKLRIIDSPGVIPYEEKAEEKMGIIGAKNPEQLKNPDLAAINIIKMFMQKNKKSLEEFYAIKIQKEIENDEEQILELIGKSRGFLKKGGITDMNRTVISLLRDWYHGRLKL